MNTLGWLGLLAIAAAGGPPDQAPLIQPPTSQPTSRPASRVDERLVKKLLGGDASTVDAMDEALHRMDQAAHRLRDAFDTGPETQQAQQRALGGIDQLIEQARKNQVSRNSSQTARRPAERRRRDGREEGRAEAGQAATGAQADGKQARAEGPAKSRAAQRPGEKAELLRGWGYLPQRDREEIVQGYDDEFLPKYSTAIARYYEDLAVAAEAARP